LPELENACTEVIEAYTDEREERVLELKE